MKQFLFLLLVTIGCGFGSLLSPYWAVLLYYGLATLRPQNLWDWALPVDVRWSLIAAGLLFLSALFHAPQLIIRSRINAVCGLMLAYAILVLMSVLSAINPSLAERWAVEYGKIFAVAIVASLVIHQFREIQLLTLVALASIGFLAYEINYDYLIHGRLDVFHQGYGGFDNNGVGLLLAMGLPLAVGFASARYERWSWGIRGLAVAAGVLMAHAVMLTYSRGAMVAAVAGMVWQLGHHRPRWQAASGAAAAVAVVLLLAGPQIRDEFLSTGNFQQDGSAQARFQSWDAAWTMAWDFPLFGTGLRNSNLYSHNYGADIAGRTIHNQYLQVAADSGVPAASCYVALLFVSLWYLRKARITATEARDANPDLHPAGRRQLESMARTCLAIQSSLVLFVVGGIFLSLEVFELPWLLMVLAGVAPAAVASRVGQLIAPETTPATAAPEGIPRARLLGALS